MADDQLLQLVVSIIILVALALLFWRQDFDGIRSSREYHRRRHARESLSAQEFFYRFYRDSGLTPELVISFRQFHATYWAEDPELLRPEDDLFLINSGSDYAAWFAKITLLYEVEIPEKAREGEKIRDRSFDSVLRFIHQVHLSRGLQQVPYTDRSLFQISQALFQQSATGAACLAASPGIREEWEPRLRELCEAYGPPIADSTNREAIFVQPVDAGHVAVVQVFLPANSIITKFRFLIIQRRLYLELNDPFAIADRFPANWERRSDLHDLAWETGPLPPRSLNQLQEVLKKGDGPMLLGTAQCLVDGGKLLLKRKEPFPEFVRGVWDLLPESNRREAWVTTFALSSKIPFDILILPELPSEEIGNYRTEEQVRDYPDSFYERNLQYAVEMEDEALLRRLLARRSGSETIRMGLWLIGLMAILIAVWTALNVIWKH